MSQRENLNKLESLFRKFHNLISYAFSRRKHYPKNKSQWWYPHIMTYSGSEIECNGCILDLVRNYEKNGAAHILIDYRYHVRLSNCCFITSTGDAYISFNVEDFQSQKFDKLDYWLFINEKHNCVIKVNWRKLKMILNPDEAENGYLNVNVNTYPIFFHATKYSLEKVPSDYLHPINYESQKRLFTGWIAGSHKRKVRLTRTDGRVCEFDTLKQFFERLSHFNVKFNISNYNCLKTMMSRKVPFRSKCGLYQMTYAKKDKVWVFSISRKYCAMSVSGESVCPDCTLCDDDEKAEIEREAEFSKLNSLLGDLVVNRNILKTAKKTNCETTGIIDINNTSGTKKKIAHETTGKLQKLTHPSLLGDSMFSHMSTAVVILKCPFSYVSADLSSFILDDPFSFDPDDPFL